MNIKTKAILCAIVITVTIAVHKIATPVAHVVANQTIAAQMDNTNSSYIAAQVTGNGEGWLDGALLVVAGSLIGYILTRKGKQ